MKRNSNCKTCGWLSYAQEKYSGEKWKFCSCPDVHYDGINQSILSRVGYCEHHKKQTAEQKEFWKNWESSK